MSKQQMTEYTYSQTALAVRGELPEQFRQGPHTQAMQRYIEARWIGEGSVTYSYWSKRQKDGISYNAEWTPEHTRDKVRWVDHPDKGLRFVGEAHEIRGSGDYGQPYFDRALIDHTGWFTDNFHEEKVCGLVYQMPARDGKPLYVPAVSDSAGNDGAILDFHSTTDDLTDAIRWSDSMAERYAENEREYQAKQAAEDRIKEIVDEVKSTREQVLALLKEIRTNCGRLSGLTEVRKALRRQVGELRASIKELLEEKEKVENEGIQYY